MLQMRMIQRTALSYLSAAEHCLLSNCCRSIIGLTFVVSQAMQAGMKQERRKFERKTSENFAKKLDRLERCNKKRLYESRKEDGVAFMDSLKMRK